MNIKDNVIIVTGASMGIGLATAQALGAKGAKVVLAARSRDKLHKASKEIPHSLAVVTDMRSARSIENLVKETMHVFGRIDALINNAGQGMYTNVESINIDDYRSIIELNVIGPLIAMQHVIPIMREQKGGSIVNISSRVSKHYFPNFGAYASTKYALNSLTLTARAELEKDGITVSLVHPTLTDTEFGKNSVQTEIRAAMAPRRREGMPPPDSAEYVAGKIIETLETGVAEMYMHE